MANEPINQHDHLNIMWCVSSLIGIFTYAGTFLILQMVTLYPLPIPITVMFFFLVKVIFSMLHNE
jgi:hypothetical protein